MQNQTAPRSPRVQIFEPLVRLARHAAQGMIELALPARCPACDALTDESEPLCALCARTVDPIVYPCPRCGLALPPPAAAVVAPCLACQKAPPPWSSARAPFAFSGDLAVAIRRMKLGPDVLRVRALARLLAPSLARLPPVDVLVPVPLHPNRLREREFNQASQLARLARARRGVPVVEALDRVRDTPPQGRLDAPSRRANMRNAFAVPARMASRVEGAALCLVDDVLTTGATAAACTLALRRAGASRVHVLTLARTLP